MCLYPIYGENKRYRANKKNKGNIPTASDERLKIVPYKCGKCIECRKQKQREWRVRLSEELKSSFGYFVTLTFSNESLQKLEKQTGLKWKQNPNEVAKKGLRMFLERIRKATGKSMKHWFVTELGEDYDRIHLHGITFGQETANLLRKHWNYGNIFIGTFVNERSINYMTKYMLKVDVKHKNYTQIVLCSAGIGHNYIEKSKNWKWQKENYKKINVPTYTFRNGEKMAMPKYYKDRIFTDKERETMWLNNLDRGIEYIGGEPVDANDFKTIENLRKYYRKQGEIIYFDDPQQWDEQKMERKMQRQREAVAKYKKKFAVKEKKRTRMQPIII